MPKKNPEKTPRSKVKNILRRLSLYCRERGYAKKRDENTCQICGKKESKAKGKVVKVEMHHLHGIDWEGVVDIIIEKILQKPGDYICYCEDCHKEKHQSL